MNSNVYQTNIYKQSDIERRVTEIEKRVTKQENGGSLYNCILNLTAIIVLYKYYTS